MVAVVDGCLGLDSAHRRHRGATPELLQPRGIDRYEFDSSHKANGESDGWTLFVAPWGLMVWTWSHGLHGAATSGIPVILSPTARLPAMTPWSLVALLGHEVPAMRSATVERLLRDQAEPMVCVALTSFIDHLSEDQWDPANAGGVALVSNATAPCLVPALQRALFRKGWTLQAAQTLVHMVGARERAALVLDLIDRGLMGQASEALVPCRALHQDPSGPADCLSAQDADRFIGDVFQRAIDTADMSGKALDQYVYSVLRILEGFAGDPSARILAELPNVTRCELQAPLAHYVGVYGQGAGVPLDAYRIALTATAACDPAYADIAMRFAIKVAREGDDTAWAALALLLEARPPEFRKRLAAAFGPRGCAERENSHHPHSERVLAMLSLARCRN